MEAIGQIRIVFFRIVFLLLARDDDPLLKREDDEAMPLRVECCCCAANIIPVYLCLVLILRIRVLFVFFSSSSSSSDFFLLRFFFVRRPRKQSANFFLPQAIGKDVATPCGVMMEHPRFIIFEREKKTKRNRKNCFSMCRSECIRNTTKSKFIYMYTCIYHVFIHPRRLGSPRNRLNTA